MLHRFHANIPWFPLSKSTVLNSGPPHQPEASQSQSKQSSGPRFGHRVGGENGGAGDDHLIVAVAAKEAAEQHRMVHLDRAIRVQEGTRLGLAVRANGQGMAARESG